MRKGYLGLNELAKGMTSAHRVVHDRFARSVDCGALGCSAAFPAEYRTSIGRGTLHREAELPLNVPPAWKLRDITDGFTQEPDKLAVLIHHGLHQARV